ncbi:MAG: hypothetical protein ABIH92_02455, partial [Nanoarchaeota archaeon]
MVRNISSKGISRELRNGDFRVTIFGSARVDKKDRAYKHTYELAKRIGKRGFDLITGGGPG